MKRIILTSLRLPFLPLYLMAIPALPVVLLFKFTFTGKFYDKEVLKFLCTAYLKDSKWFIGENIK